MFAPVTLETSKSAPGLAVPIPTLPALVTTKLSALVLEPICKLEYEFDVPLTSISKPD